MASERELERRLDNLNSEYLPKLTLARLLSGDSVAIVREHPEVVVEVDGKYYRSAGLLKKVAEVCNDAVREQTTGNSDR
jgi:hypothetical protein